MKRMILLAIALMLLTSMAFAQMNGSVSGTVRDSLNNPVDDAMIRLMTGCGGGRHHGGGMGQNYSTQSGPDGTFSIANVAAGDYIAVASKMMVGHDADSITVVAGENTVVNFVLNCGGGGGMHGDSLVTIEVAGFAIVITDSMHTQYFLDNNGDGEADYRLLFGPDWYDPGNGAQRPNDGDSIWVTGGIMGYSLPQAVVVYEINGLFWREPGSGHGGYGGDGGGCPDPDSLTLIETSGITITREIMGMTHYFLDSNFDQTSEYCLNFGAPSYDPGNGAERPSAGDTVEIVGGLMDGCMNGEVIIVYEINGQFWRQPGDTTGLWILALSVDDPQPLPVNYLIASSYPNPFNPSATISFELPIAGHARVTVYDILGNEVAVLADGNYPAGVNKVQFNSSNFAIGSTVYFYKVNAGENSATGKMILLK